MISGPVKKGAAAAIKAANKMQADALKDFRKSLEHLGKKEQREALQQYKDGLMELEAASDSGALGLVDNILNRVQSLASNPLLPAINTFFALLDSATLESRVALMGDAMELVKSDAVKAGLQLLKDTLSAAGQNKESWRSMAGSFDSMNKGVILGSKYWPLVAEAMRMSFIEAQTGATAFQVLAGMVEHAGTNVNTLGKWILSLNVRIGEIFFNLDSFNSKLELAKERLGAASEKLKAWGADIKEWWDGLGT